MFHEYRAYDDFEEQPLHGTFLIDERGNVRWQDISYEPFMDPKFVLAESQRLLSQSRNQNHELAGGPQEQPDTDRSSRIEPYACILYWALMGPIWQWRVS